MRKFLVLFLFLSSFAYSQTATISGTITDGAGQTFNNGTYKIELVPAFGFNNTIRTDTGLPVTPTQLNGTLSSGGAFSGVVVTKTNFIGPAGAQWKFTVCPDATSGCFTYSTVITADGDLSAGLSAASGTINVGVNYVKNIIPTAYNSAEVSGMTRGSLYYNTTTLSLFAYDGTNWVDAVANGFSYAPNFGLVSGTSNTTVGFQAGINAVSITHGTLLIPPGIYTITSQLNVAGTGGFNILCTGEGAVIQFDGSLVPTAFGSPDTTQRSRISMSGCRFNSTAAGQGTAIDASHMAISKFEDIAMTGVNKCIVMNNVHSLYNIVTRPNCTISGAGSVGLKFDSTANENSVFKARIHPDANATCVSVNSQGVKLYDVDCETGALIGLDIQASARGTIAQGGWLEANQTNLHIAAGAQTPSIIGMEINSGTTANFTDDGSVGLNLCGTRIQFVSQPCNFAAGLTTPNLTATQATIDGLVGTNRDLTFSTSGLARWKFRANTTAEGGANSGSDFSLLSRDDAGNALFGAMTCTRSTGDCQFFQRLIAGIAFTSGNANPATVGMVRLNKSDTIKIRNNANSADITLLSLDASDIATLPSVKVGASGSTISDTRALVQSVFECGTTTTCANTANNSDHIIHGNVALSSASPSTATIASISPAFTSTATYNCTATPEGTTAAIAAGGIAISKISGSSFTLTGPNTVTTVVDYTCTGH